MTPALAGFVAVVAAWIAAEAATTPLEPDLDAPRERATGLALLAAHAAAVVEHVVRAPDVPAAAAIAGAAVAAAGVAVRIWAIRALGPRFVSTTAEPDRVVAAGPYRWLRHPSELGLLAAVAGGALLVGSAVAAAIGLGVLAPLAAHRCAAEDRARRAVAT